MPGSVIFDPYVPLAVLAAAAAVAVALGGWAALRGLSGWWLRALAALVLPQGPLFITDAHIGIDPSVEQIVNTTLASARRVSDFGIRPKIALLSHSLHCLQLFQITFDVLKNIIVEIEANYFV